MSQQTLHITIEQRPNTKGGSPRLPKPIIALFANYAAALNSHGLSRIVYTTEPTQDGHTPLSIRADTSALSRLQRDGVFQELQKIALEMMGVGHDVGARRSKRTQTPYITGRLKTTHTLTLGR